MRCSILHMAHLLVSLQSRLLQVLCGTCSQCRYWCNTLLKADMTAMSLAG